MVANGHVSAFNNVFRKRPTGTAVFWARMVVEFSEDLRTWAPLTTNTVPGSLEIFIGGGSGFYRAVVLP